MKRVSPGDLLRLYRVRDWLHFLPLPVGGWLAGGGGDRRALVGGVLGWAFGLAYTSSINQAFDDRLDKPQPGKNPVGGRLDRRGAILLSVPPAVACVAVEAALAPRGLAAAVFLVVVATLYSAPPRLKRVPVLGTVWNVVIGLPGFFLADDRGLAQPPLRLLTGLFALLLVVSQLIHEAEDRDDDRSGGVSTVATIAGVRGALGAACAVLVAVPPASYFLASGLRNQAPLAAVSVVFACAWLAALGRRALRGDATALRRVRLRYRAAALAFGAAAFAAAAV